MASRRLNKTLIAALAVVGLTLAACGSSDDSSAAETDTSAETTVDVGTSDDSDAADDSNDADADESDDASADDTDDAEADDTETDDAGQADECAVANLDLKTPGQLTIATDEPVFEPWFVDNDPANGEGFEGAIAYALAEQLGFANDDVVWVRASFDSVISPAPKDFDFDINEFSITPERAAVVDFSSGYYDVTQAVVTVAGSKIADATSIADLKDATLGAQIGTTSLDAINEAIKPNTQPAALGANIDAVAALQNGQIDGIVTDLPTAFYMAAAQLDDGIIIGQLPPTGGDVEQFGLLLEKDSGFTSCLSQAVDALRADGTLDAIATEWLAGAGAPELK